MSIYEQNQIAEQIARVFDSHGVTVEDMKEINELVESLTKEGDA